MRDGDGGAVASFFLPVEVALQFDIHIAASEYAMSCLDLLASFFHAAMLQGSCQRPIGAAGQANQTVGMLFQFLFLNCAPTFFRAQLHFGDQAAEILITRAGGNEERKAEWFVIFIYLVIQNNSVIPRYFVIPSGARNPYALHCLLVIGILRLGWRCAALRAISAQNDKVQWVACDFCADVRFGFEFFCCQVKARRAVDAIGIEHRHGGHVESVADSCQIFGQGRAFEEAERGAGMELDVGHPFP